ncbi:type II toxin-antitoxin system RelE/ParE family toxin [Fluviispira sanaruensis]|uniref:Addiction module toxin RelE n=1 Tax=Fluviispira sanaruensis TaxID=2493639 RepID=A0A4P2VQK1_FLUSA|nr:type II toxin-antitoxin system RelE/ParE family toxin [Fluviispira sanaruensis]BBH54690.1 hypothetical protein JCM31447_31640 [Fluviispira sanaruensis]
MWEIEFFEDKRGKKPVQDWFAKLAKPDQKEIAKLLGLLEIFGYELALPHAKNLGGGIYELRAKAKGAGYRVYYTFKNDKIIILLVAGDKSTQQRDIEKARNLKESL